MVELVIKHLGGFCPVQAEGTINGHPFYFRARHEEWTLGIAEWGQDPIDIDFEHQGYFVLQPYGEGPEEAGYMTHEVARAIIQEQAEIYAQKRSSAS